MKLKDYIKDQKKKQKALSTGAQEVKAIMLEVNGMFKQNIPNNITPKTIKPKGKTLYKTGDGQRGITTIFENGIIKTGNSVEYMGYHLTGTKHIPQRNWLKEPDDLEKTMIAWINKFMSK